MRAPIIILAGCAFLLSGCDLIRMLLPRHATTSAEARRALERCSIIPDSIAWHVSRDGVFTFGRKSADAAPMTEAQTQCVMRWVEERRIKVAFIGSELHER
jgi:hypothetical protein